MKCDGQGRHQSISVALVPHFDMVVVIEGCKLCATKYNGSVVGPYCHGNRVPWITNGNDGLVIHTYHGSSLLMLDSQFLHHVELVGSIL